MTPRELASTALAGSPEEFCEAFDESGVTLQKIELELDLIENQESKGFEQ